MLKNQLLSGGPEEDRTPDLLIANDTPSNDIKHLRLCCGAINSQNTGGAGTNLAQWESVLTERPGAHREWSADMTAALWIAMGLAAVAVLGVAFANWLTKKVRSGESREP